MIEMFEGRHIPFLILQRDNVYQNIHDIQVLSLGEERDVHIWKVEILKSNYLVFKQQRHNSLSQVNPCHLSIRCIFFLCTLYICMEFIKWFCKTNYENLNDYVEEKKSTDNYNNKNKSNNCIKIKK